MAGQYARRPPAQLELRPTFRRPTKYEAVDLMAELVRTRVDRDATAAQAARLRKDLLREQASNELLRAANEKLRARIVELESKNRGQGMGSD